MEGPNCGSTQRILIVDDSPRARLLVETVLRSQGYSCLTSVESAQAAFRALGIEPDAGTAPPEFDLILMDLLMPEVDGIEACRRIKSCQRFVDVPLIMVTAEDSPECLKAAFEAGAMDYVKKPVNRVELAARVQSALRLKQETDCRKARERALEELTEKLRLLSNVDGLTEVANRRHFDTELARVWRRTEREGGTVALVMIDIDHFNSYIVVLQAEDRQFGLVVDGISDTQEIVVKPLGKQFKGLNCYAGATIMGDGRVALILDVLGIAQKAGVVQESREQSRAGKEQNEHALGDRQAFLLFRAGSFARVAVPLSLVARLEEFPQAKIEHAGGRRVVQYRGRILPLASLGSILEDGAADTAGAADPAQAIVFTDGDRTIGLLVDQILDIVEDNVAVRRSSDRKGLLGSAVIGKKVADLLDLHAVIESADDHWFGGRESESAEAITVLVLEPSAFSRGLVRNTLEMAGYRVVEAADTQEALRVLEKREIAVVVASAGLEPPGQGGLRERMQASPRFSGIPILTLADTAEQTAKHHEPQRDIEDYQLKFDRAAMLRSVAKLAAAVNVERSPVLAGDRG